MLNRAKRFASKTWSIPVEDLELSPEHSLLRAYLEARSSKQRITTELRTLYRYVSASNGLSGAIRYHLLQLIDPGRSRKMKSDSARILRSSERVMQRVTEASGDSSID